MITRVLNKAYFPLYKAFSEKWLSSWSLKIRIAMKNWADISSQSELLAVQEIKKSFDVGDLADVEEGLNILIDSS